MLHRGPDGKGEYCSGQLVIGMRRLSVIDLQGGWQPLFSRAGRVAAFQNGEIYNHRVLRAELEARGYVFRTQSDTEVLAHGYDCWSIDGLLGRLDGMFALAIHDQDSNELHLARDRFGEKPLFYSARPDGFVFSSTLLAASTMPWVSDDIDLLSLDRYLALHFTPGRCTILRDVERVLPGERLSIKLDEFAVQRRRYYVPHLGFPQRVGDDVLAAELEHAVRSRLISDVPVGVFLSGGVDSSMIAAIACSANPDIVTFSMGFDNPHVDESEAARTVAKHIGSRHYEFVFNRSHFDKLVAEVAGAWDEQLGDQAILPLFWLSREVKKHATVVLSGEGADEIFARYNYYQSFIDDGDWRALLRSLLDPAAAPLSAVATNRLLIDSARCTPSGFPLLSSASDRADLLSANPSQDDRWERDLVSWFASAHDPLQRATAVDLATWLADDLLVKVDRMTMANSVEGRAPFLAPALVEYALNLPRVQRMTKTAAKIALRRIAERYLPADIVKRRKQGFVLPMRTWLESWFKFHGNPASYLARRPFPSLNSARAANLVTADLAAGVQRERLLFALIMLLEWWAGFQSRRSSLVRACRALDEAKLKPVAAG